MANPTRFGNDDGTRKVTLTDLEILFGDRFRLAINKPAREGV